MVVPVGGISLVTAVVRVRNVEKVGAEVGACVETAVTIGIWPGYQSMLPPAVLGSHPSLSMVAEAVMIGVKDVVGQAQASW